MIRGRDGQDIIQVEGGWKEGNHVVVAVGIPSCRHVKNWVHARLVESGERILNSLGPRTQTAPTVIRDADVLTEYILEVIHVLKAFRGISRSPVPSTIQELASNDLYVPADSGHAKSIIPFRSYCADDMRARQGVSVPISQSRQAQRTC